MRGKLTAVVLSAELTLDLRTTVQPWRYGMLSCIHPELSLGKVVESRLLRR